MCRADARLTLDALAWLQAQTSDVRFVAARHGFVASGVLQRGVTSAIQALLPVPRHEPPVADCPGCTARVRGERRATRLRALGVIISARKRQRRAAAELVRVGPAAPPPPPPNRCRGGPLACMHGLIVDADVAAYVADPASVADADPCSVTLLAHLASRGLVPVACQVPIHSQRLRLATAIDVLCVDAQTRTQLHLVEVKASRTAGRAPAPADACYRYAAPDTTTLLDGRVVASSYWAHQLQLWAMATTLEREYGLVLASATVLRTSPSHVFRYPLHPALAAHAVALTTAFCAPAL